MEVQGQKALEDLTIGIERATSDAKRQHQSSARADEFTAALNASYVQQYFRRRGRISRSNFRST